MTGRQSLGNVTGGTSSALRVTPAGAGLAFPPLVGAGCVSGRGVYGRQTRVRALSVGPGSIGFDLTPHWQVEHGSTKYEPQ
ncbi:hypothetical protein D7319_17210 [Streptomyces radicis]|uniref:Uncharacterized protein n=1 Tax=Streptomyces radicis TaxID=1750517 RepID=A0A3A9W3V3_9ACTN|nr:hypothetical protein D7319_17210 [Streptomyces radicis]RKN20787.1 hypothetical protein D7318_17710 [Streptomyces radicis]